MFEKLFLKTKYSLRICNFTIVFTFFLICGCLSNNYRYHIIPQPENPFTQENIPIIFEGTVIERLPSPMFWAGDIPSFQGIRYKVNRVIEGKIKDSQIIVYHLLANPQLCEKDEPILSKIIFKIGNNLKIFCEKTPNEEFVCWEHGDNVIILEK